MMIGTDTLRRIILEKGWGTALNIIEEADFLDNWIWSNAVVLGATGLQNFLVIDGDLSPFFDDVRTDLPLQGIRGELKASLIDALIEQVDAGGTTTLYDIDLISTPSEAELVPRIVELRNREMVNVVVSEKDGLVDLQTLWLTAHGFRILKALQVGLFEKERIEILADAFEEAGFPVTISGKRGRFRHRNVSRNMADHIRFLAVEGAIQEDASGIEKELEVDGRRFILDRVFTHSIEADMYHRGLISRYDSLLTNKAGVLGKWVVYRKPRVQQLYPPTHPTRTLTP